jgi:4-carboxymuconolactone decarboxylase
MASIDFSSPREAARAFAPKLSALVGSPLYDQVWADPALSLRDRSLVTIATLIAMGHADELPAHLHRAIQNGVTRPELSALMTHMAFYAGFPAAISAAAIAHATLDEAEEK